MLFGFLHFRLYELLNNCVLCVLDFPCRNAAFTPAMYAVCSSEHILNGTSLIHYGRIGVSLLDSVASHVFIFTKNK